MLDILSKGSTPEGEQRLRFGNFEIINDDEGRPLLLGKGTFGRTYKACHRFLDTVVALKIINERYAADAGVRQRFLIEARAVAKLSHPHIARLHDFGEMEGVLHYAMEYCGGGDLSEHVEKHGPLPIPQVIEVGQQISGALKCAHTAGFIHRDLKPSNIMLTSSEGPLFTKLIDFGLVRAGVPGNTRSFDDELASSDGPRFLGTPLFASPEQLREETVDFRTDLFALGISLWYLLLGGAPEKGSSAEIAASRLSPHSYEPRLPGDLPPSLRDIIARLVEKDRKSRFASAAEAQRAFQECAATLGVKRTGDLPPEIAVEEEEAAGPSTGAGTTQPVELETVDAPLSSAYSILSRVNEDFTGLNYIAEPTDDLGGGVFLHVLHGALLEDSAAFDRFRVHVAQLVELSLPEVLTVKGLRAFSDYTVLVLEKPEATDLNTVLRAHSAVNLADARQMLEKIATVCDRLSVTGAPGVQLATGRILLDWPDGGASAANSAGARSLNAADVRLFPRLLAVGEAPNLASEAQDISATMTTDLLGDPTRADNHAEHFGTLLYRIVAGRNCPLAASLSPQVYVAVPGLTEQSNRILSMVIAKQVEYPSCSQMFREILSAEGILSRGGNQATARSTGGTAGVSVGQSRVAAKRTPPPSVAPTRSVAPTAPPPPVAKPAPLPSARASTAPPNKTPPPVVAKTPTPATKPPSAPPVPAVVAKAPTPPSAAPAPVVETRAPSPPQPAVQKVDLPPAPQVVSKAAPPPPRVEVRESAQQQAPPPKAAPIQVAKVEPPRPAPPPPAPAAVVESRPQTAVPAAPPPAKIQPKPAPVPVAARPAPIRAAAPATATGVPAAEPAQSSPSKWKPIALAAAAVLVLGGVAAGVVAYTMMARRGTPVAANEQPSSPSQPVAQPAAGDSVIHIQGDLPNHTTFLAGTAKLNATKNGSGWEVNVAKQAPPFDLTVAAQGYDRFVLPIKSKDDVAKAQTVALARSTGALSLTRKFACDYTSASFKMVEPLPEDVGFVKVDSTPRERNLTDAAAPLALPTGVYDVVLTGADPNVVAPLQGMRVSVKAASNQAIELPRSIAGQYVGQLKSTQPGANDTAERQVSIDPKITTGSVTENRPGGAVTVQLSNGRLDSRGIYTARAAFASVTGGARADEDVQISRGQEGAIDATFTGTKPAYALSGTLRPGTMQASARPPSPAPDVAAAPNIDQQAKAKADEASRTASAGKSEGGRAKSDTPAHAERSASSSSSGSRSAPPPAPREVAKPAPAATAAKRERAFQGTAPGG
jgi:serine/threonine protein kinase